MWLVSLRITDALTTISRRQNWVSFIYNGQFDRNDEQRWLWWQVTRKPICKRKSHVHLIRKEASIYMSQQPTVFFIIKIAKHKFFF